jgi:methyl-accepting chemotaxis protein
MPAKKFQRKIIFIKKSMQYKFVIFVLGAVLFGMSFVFYEFINLLEDFFAKHPVLLYAFFEEGYGLLLGFGVKVLVCFAVLTLITAMLSNKIAGPVYKMEVTFKKVAKGDWGARACLRYGDACGDLAKEFNDMMDVLEPKLKQNARNADSAGGDKQ